jgi:hypothetical protein
MSNPERTTVERLDDEAVVRRVRSLLSSEAESGGVEAQLINAIYLGEREEVWDYLAVAVVGRDSTTRSLHEYRLGLTKPASPLEDAVIESDTYAAVARDYDATAVPRLANALAATYARIDAVFRLSPENSLTPEVVDATRGEPA